MNTYLVDAYAWIEYFKGSTKAQVFRELLLDTSKRFITAECNLAELRMWAIRERKNFDNIYQIIQSNSSLSPVMLNDWLEAAKMREEMRKTRDHFGLIDAVLLVKQRELNCEIISGDPHFKGLPNVLFLE